MLPWKRAQHGSPFLSRLSDDIFSTKAKRQKKISFSSRGMRGKSNPSTPLAPNASVAPGGGPWDSAGQPRCAALSLRRSHPPRAPGSDTPICPRLGKNLQASNPAFPIVFLPERRSLGRESFRAGAIPGRGWRQRLPLPRHKGKKSGIDICIYFNTAFFCIFFPLHKSSDVSPLRG